MVPHGVQLGVGGQQLGSSLLATRDREVSGDARADLEPALLERVGEALRAVLRQGQGVDAGDLTDDGVVDIRHLLADVLASADAHAVVVAEDRDPRRIGVAELAVDVDDGDSGLHCGERSLRERRTVARQHHDGVDTLVDELLDRGDLLRDVVRALGLAELDVVEALGGLDRSGVDRAEPAVVGLGPRPADDDVAAGGSVVARRLLGRGVVRSRSAGVLSSVARTSDEQTDGCRRRDARDESPFTRCVP